MNQCLHIISRAISDADLQQCRRVLGPKCALLLVGRGLEMHSSLRRPFLEGQRVYLVVEENQLPHQHYHQEQRISYSEFVDLCIQFPSSRTW